MAKMVANMLEEIIRVGFLIVVGLALGVGIVWYLSFLYREITGTSHVVIDRFVVVRNDGKGDDDLGKALAQMLQVRLQALASELRDAEAGLTTNVSASALTGKQSVTPVGDVRLWTQAVSLQTSLLQPVDMKLSVAGVEVGGLIPWIQRGLTSRRTLQFTVYLQGNEAQIFGSIGALRLSDDGLRLSVKGPGESAPALVIIVDKLAHEILRRHLAEDKTNKLESLDANEFLSLVEVLASAAEANRRAILGRLNSTEFADLVPKITALADQVPNWPELGYLAAKIADSGKKPDTALIYYQRVLPKFESTKQTELIGAIKVRIDALRGMAATIPVDTPQPLPASLDHSSKLKFIRDGGPEGSVVGLALATSLEFQIEKATGETRRMSARYIYYAARAAGSLDLKVDSGAQIRDGIKVLTTQGAVEEAVWPYQPGKFDEMPPPAVEKAKRFRITAVRPVNNLNDVKHALNENGSVVAGISVFQEILSPATAKTGVVPLPVKASTIMGAHAIVLVGYDDATQRVKFVNSWGSKWGEQGFGYLPYEYIEKFMTDAWTFRFANEAVQK